MTLDDCWLDAAWSFVRTPLPPTPARVLELGCGRLGGFVPALLSEGYDAVAIDPAAPDVSECRRVDFEQFDVGEPVDAIVAATSLHHVGDLDNVLDPVAVALVPGGTVVVMEWAWERFDEATARWCFARLDAPTTAAASPTEPRWLHGHRDGWLESGGDWNAYRDTWVAEAGLHRGDQILRALEARFVPTASTEGPYFFSDLAETAEADEQAAIDAGEIRATGLRFVGRL